MKQKIQFIHWAESITITLIFYMASLYLDDLLSIGAPFPWIWFAPVLIALRYGLLQAQCSILLLLLTYLYEVPLALYNPRFQLFLLGGFLLTTICSTFFTKWSRNIIKHKAISEYLQKRTQTTFYAYKVIWLAYQRLESSFISKPVTIRSSLIELRKIMSVSNNQLHDDVLKRFLNILASNCALETAAIFPVKNNQVNSTPIVSIGNITRPKAHDSIIQNCIDYGLIAHVNYKEILKGQSSNYLIAAPFIDQDNTIYAILLIEEMPFLSLNNENIGVMSVLLNYFTEGNSVNQAQLIIQAYPDCPISFSNELQRLMNLYQRIKKDSSLVRLELLQSPHQKSCLFALKQNLRGLDTLWEMHHENKVFLFVLMPLTGLAGIESYKLRINHLLLEEFGFPLNGDVVKLRSVQLSSYTNPIHLIQDLLEAK